MTSAMFLMQMGVDPLDRAAFVVAHRFGRGELDLLAPTRVVGDDRDMTETRGHRADFLGGGGGGGKIAEVRTVLETIEPAK